MKVSVVTFSELFWLLKAFDIELLASLSINGEELRVKIS